jgi:ectoine hydroxylase-related dioxygenase (phytanoyl-CoA dioxygenase family)
MTAQTFEHELGEIDEQGYTILRGAIEPDLVVALRDRLREVARERDTGFRNNPAEGFATYRTYNLLARDPLFQRMPIHDTVLSLVERVLDSGLLLSGMTAMDIGPGEKPQPIHPDDALMTVPRPHAPLMCTTIWALSEFRDANGATRIVPNSHAWERTPTYAADEKIDSIPAEMDPGDVLVMNASTWHGGGGNTTEDSWRLGVNVQYVHGWIRQQQNQWLAVPREIARTFPERLLELCGYSLYKGVMGHIDGESPAVVLGDGRLKQTAYQNEDMKLVFGRAE